METLILLRHAKAAPERAAPEDRARTLSDRGRIEAVQAGEALVAHGVKPSRVLVSTAARTRETWSLISAVLGDPPVEFRDLLYMAEAETIWAEAVRLNAETVLVVAHNPGLHDLASHLLAQASDRSRLGRTISDGMAPASWAAFTVSGDTLPSCGAALMGGWQPEG